MEKNIVDYSCLNCLWGMQCPEKKECETSCVHSVDGVYNNLCKGYELMEDGVSCEHFTSFDEMELSDAYIEEIINENRRIFEEEWRCYINGILK